MKSFFTSLCFSGLLLPGFSLQSQNPRLVKVWETDASIKTPESVLYDKENKTLYFSNIDGNPNEKDHKGSIGRLSPDGKNLVLEWVTGLNAPKGLGIYKGLLYAADIDEVIVVEIAAGKIVQRIPVAGAVFLNDITINDKGELYVSDMERGIVHKIVNGRVETFLEKQVGVNGLLIVGEDLYLLEQGVLWKANKNKVLVKVAEGMDASTDGIEQTKSKDFIVSCWSGIIYYVKADGTKAQMLDTREKKLNTADIGFDAEKNIVYVPTFFGNTITAYKLK
jgi:hypothetical protein